MITEDFVSFETARLLKEKGFDIYVRSYYQKYEYKTKEELITNDALWNYNISSFRYSAPTLQMAMKWLRKVHHIFIDIDYDSHEFGDKPYFTLITNMDTCSYYSGKHLPVNRATYEEMAEAAIKYCIENLI